jgi:hypothetical protein
MNAKSPNPILTGLILASLLLQGVANAAIKPADVQAEFKQWSQEADAILQAQPKSSALRSDLHAWLTDQGRSLSKVKEPVLSASLPSKMWGSAATILDSANQHAGELDNAEYSKLLGLAVRVIDYCHQAYKPQQSVCTDDHYWHLKAGAALYLAKLGEPDSAQQLAVIPAMVSGSIVPFQGFYSKSAEEMATDACSGWIRLLARHLTDDYFPRSRQRINEAFLNAYFASTRNVLDLCESSHADMGESIGYLTELAIHSMSMARPFGKEVQGKALPFAERAYKSALQEVPGGATDSAQPTDLMRLMVLATALDKAADTTRWATAMPGSLRVDKSRGSDDFACNYFAKSTRDLGDGWTDAVSAFPAIADELRSICPQLGGS